MINAVRIFFYFIGTVKQAINENKANLINFN